LANSRVQWYKGKEVGLGDKKDVDRVCCGRAMGVEVKRGVV
jgi:hypothetical protein